MAFCQLKQITSQLFYLYLSHKSHQSIIYTFKTLLAFTLSLYIPFISSLLYQSNKIPNATKAKLFYFIYHSLQLLYFVSLISINYSEMFPFQKLIAQLKSYDQIEGELKRLQEKGKARAEQIIEHYRQTFKVDIDKVKMKNKGFYNMQQKKEEALTEEKSTRFLQGNWLLERNENVTLINRKKVYHQHIAQAEQALKVVSKEYGQFVQVKKLQVKLLRNTILQLEARLKYADSNYQLLASGQVVEPQAGPYAGSKLYDIGLVPYLAEEIDALFQAQMGEVNLRKNELQGMKSKRNNIIGKVQYLIDLLKRKEQQKKSLEAQNDIQIEFYHKQREELQKQVDQSLLKEKEVHQLMQRSKAQHQKHTSFMIKQIRKCRHFPPQIGEFKRIMTRISGMLERYLKTEKKRKLEYNKNNTVDKKVDRLIEKAKDDQAERLQRERKEKQMQGKALLVGEYQHKQLQASNEAPEEAEIVEVANEDKVSEIGSGKVSSREQDTISSVSSRLKLQESDKLSSKSSLKQGKKEQDRNSNK